MPNLRDKDDKEIISIVTREFTRYESLRSVYEDNWRRYYKIYRKSIDQKFRKLEGANLFIPYCYQIVETVKPRIITTMFAARPYIGLVSIDPNYQGNAEVQTNLLDYQLNHRMNFVSTAGQAVTSALLYGTGITKQVWKYRTKNTKKREPVLESGITVGYNEIEVEKTVYDDPAVEYVDIFDFYCDPAIPNIRDQRSVIHRYFKTKDELKEMAKRWEVKDKVIEELSTGQVGEQSGVSQRLSDIGLSSEDSTQKDLIEVWERWSDDELIIIANRETVLFAQENPYWHSEKPFARLVDTEVPGEFYGIGEIEPLEDMQYELNTRRNQRIDNINILINRMYKILRGANIDPEQLISRPGGFVEVDGHDDIEPLEFPDVTSSAYQEEDMVKQDMDKTVGVYDYARGSSPTRRETATTATILAEASNERFKLKILLMETGWLIDVGRQLSELNKQYYDTEKTVTLMRDSEIFDVNVSPENLEGEFEFMAIGSAVEPVYNKAVRQQSLMQLFGNLAPLPFVNLPELTKQLFRAFDIRDTQKLIMQNPPVAGMPQGAGAGVNEQMMQGNAQTMPSPQMQGASPQAQNQEMILQMLQALPPEVQAEIGNLPPEQQMAVIMELMGGQMNGQPQAQ